MSQPLIVQSDFTLLVETADPAYPELRGVLARFAELLKSPEHVHTYRITPLSLWNAAASGLRAQAVLATLEAHTRYPIPPNVRSEIGEQMARYGRVKLVPRDGAYALVADDAGLMVRLRAHRHVAPLLGPVLDERSSAVSAGNRGWVKQALVKIGWPVEDLAGYEPGEPLSIALRDVTQAGLPLSVRAYQAEAAEIFWAGGGPAGGSGVIVLPCGAGKTLVGMAVMERVKAQALVLATSTLAVRQWRRELLDKTTLADEDIGEYTGLVKNLRPVTLATYHILVHRKRRDEDFTHFRIFDAMNWGLIVYDEVHLLPAEVFRATAMLQARRRLGLTATLVREDGLEADVFSLIGPKRYDAPWKDLERQGWIARALCTEVRVDLPDPLIYPYANASDRQKFVIASTNPQKQNALWEILRRHAAEPALIIAQFLDQVDAVARHLGAPRITGKTPIAERERLLASFRRGEIPVLVLSPVGNFSIDLPEASLLVQLSGTFGSRQEEAQRLGRILRPKADSRPARFYTIVTRRTNEQDYAANRQRFLAEQGYAYEIESPEELVLTELASAPRMSLC